MGNYAEDRMLARLDRTRGGRKAEPKDDYVKYSTRPVTVDERACVNGARIKVNGTVVVKRSPTRKVLVEIAPPQVAKKVVVEPIVKIEPEPIIHHAPRPVDSRPETPPKHVVVELKWPEPPKPEPKAQQPATLNAAPLLQKFQGGQPQRQAPVANTEPTARPAGKKMSKAQAYKKKFERSAPSRKQKLLERLEKLDESLFFSWVVKDFTKFSKENWRSFINQAKDFGELQSREDQIAALEVRSDEIKAECARVAAARVTQQLAR